MAASCVSFGVLAPRQVAHATTTTVRNRTSSCRVSTAGRIASSKAMAGLTCSNAGVGFFHSSEVHGLSLRSPLQKISVKSREYATVTKASFFGVGAPEALVIGVVALLVFGPKGLAEAARSVGQALRAFQPTIRELQEVSNEFKTTLEKEIGYEEIKNDIRGAVSGTSAPKPKQAGPLPEDAKPIEEVAKGYTDVMEIEPKKVTPTLSAEEDVVTEEMKQKAASAAWGTDAAGASDVVKDVNVARDVNVVEATPAAPKVEKQA